MKNKIIAYFPENSKARSIVDVNTYIMLEKYVQNPLNDLMNKHTTFKVDYMTKTSLPPVTPPLLSIIFRITNSISSYFSNSTKKYSTEKTKYMTENLDPDFLIAQLKELKSNGNTTPDKLKDIDNKIDQLININTLQNNEKESILKKISILIKSSKKSENSYSGVN